MAYLFTHFTREDDGGEQVYFAVSRDGLHWKDLYDRPALTWDRGDRGIRDPYIVRHPVTGIYYIMATDLCIAKRNHQWDGAVHHGSRDLVFWSSSDLVHWSEPWAVTLAPEDGGCAWAPEAVWDTATDSFLIFFASHTGKGDQARQRIYAAHTHDFVTFSDRFLYIERARHIIDTTIFRENGIYYRFSANGGIRLDRCADLEGEFVSLTVPAVEALRGVEGPECYRLPDGKWCLIVDRFKEGLGYLPVVLDDIEAGEAHVLDDAEFDFSGILKRHGGVIAISDEEYDRMCAAAGI